MPFRRQRETDGHARARLNCPGICEMVGPRRPRLARLTMIMGAVSGRSPGIGNLLPACRARLGLHTAWRGGMRLCGRGARTFFWKSNTLDGHSSPSNAKLFPSS